ncbi:MAG: DNA-directed RNA polymerase subunit omega [Bacteroidota bacterium]
MKTKKENFLPVDIQKVGTLSGNIYKSLVIISRRSNQVTQALKDELTKKLAEFAPAYDNLEEVMENKEQIEISRFYERKPKATQVALEEFLDDEVYFRDPNEDAL